MTEAQEKELAAWQEKEAARWWEVKSYLRECEQKGWLHWCHIDPATPVFGSACACMGCVDKRKVTPEEFIRYLEMRIRMSSPLQTKSAY